MKINLFQPSAPDNRRAKMAFSNTKWLLFLFQFLTVFLVYTFQIKKLSERSLLFGAGLLVVSLLSLTLLRIVSKKEVYLFLIANMIFTIGIIMIYRLDPGRGERQLMIYLASLVAFFLVYFIMRRTYTLWEGHLLFYYGVTLVFFFITLVFGLTLSGARNWITIANINVQPSEFAKIPFVLFIASWYKNYEHYEKTFLGCISLTVMVYILLGLFLLQKELGTAAIFFATLLTTQIAFERHRWVPVVNLLLACVGLFVAYHLFSHVRVRFDMWLDPWKDFNNKGYQIIQALFAIAEGGFFGTGIGLGHPDSIPLGHSDFIFASVVEEMGAFMGICVILLFVLLLYRGFKIAMQQERDFYAAVAVAVSAIFASQAIVMFAGVLKVIPLTGITVPFLTYGGSSLLSSFVLLALLQTCSEDWMREGGTYATK